MRLDLASRLRDRLADYDLGIAGHLLEEMEVGVPTTAVITHPRGSRQYALLYSPMMTMTEVSREVALPGQQALFVIGPRITERSADMFRRLDVHFLDQAGNAYLDFDGVHIDVRGRRGQRDQAADVPGHRGGNLFSTKRSQVIFALLAWPELASAPLRVLARTSGASLGQVQETMNRLEEAGYLSDRELRRGADLLEQWTSAFPTGLGGPFRQRSFHGDARDVRAPDDVDLLISGEAAVSQYIRPETMTIYAGEFTGKVASLNRWRTDREPNIFVRTRFWRDPYEEPVLGEVRVAPSVLIYADLRASGDSRQAEAAQLLRGNDDRLQRL